MQLDLFGASPKTSPVSSTPGTTPSDASWERLWERIPHSRLPQADGGVVRVSSMDRYTAQRGASWTRKVSSRSGEGGFLWSLHGLVLGEIPAPCFTRPKPRLADILETGPIPDRFFLTPSACAGILRRAETRGKEISGMLKDALRQVADRRQRGAGT
jgi:hypothetical protein